MTRLRWFAAALAGLGTVAGCATVDARPDYLRTAREVERATGHAGPEDPADEARAASAVRALLADGLSADEAMKVALVNNPNARALLLQVGMARADVVQAGLWSNPTLGFSFRLPEGGGVANFELGLAQNIADLWMIPSRQRAARRDLDRTVLTVARQLVALALDTKAAYYDALAADAALGIAQDNVDLTRRLLDVTRARLEAGTVGSTDVNLARGQSLRAEAELRTARLTAATARRTLATLLGLTVAADELVLADELPAPRDAALPVDAFVETALTARLDARAARAAVEAAAAGVQLELRKVFRNVEVGLALERSERRGQPGRKLLADTARTSIANGALTAPGVQSRGQRRMENSQQIEAILGPSLSLELPIFDQNQAQIAKARMVYLERRAARNALERSIVQDTRQAADRLATAWDIANLYEREAMPQAQETLQLFDATYRSGQTTILNVIEAQRLVLETRQARVAALRSAAEALTELERATARPLADLLENAHANATERATGAQSDE